MSRAEPEPLPRLAPWGAVEDPAPVHGFVGAGGTHFASEWPAWVLELIAPDENDSGGMIVVKIGLIVLSAPVVAVAALAGFAVDKIVDLAVFVFTPFKKLFEALMDSSRLSETFEILKPKAANVILESPEEEVTTDVKGTANETVPPLPDKHRARGARH